MSVLAASDAVTSYSAPTAMGSLPGIGAFLRTDTVVISLLVVSVALLTTVIVLATKATDRPGAAESEDTEALVSTAELPTVESGAPSPITTAPLPTVSGTVAGPNESASR